MSGLLTHTDFQKLLFILPLFILACVWGYLCRNILITQAQTTTTIGRQVSIQQIEPPSSVHTENTVKMFLASRVSTDGDQVGRIAYLLSNLICQNLSRQPRKGHSGYMSTPA